MGLGVLDGVLGPAIFPDGRQVLFGSGVPVASPLRGHLLWDLALITPGLALIQPVHLVSQGR